MPGGSAPGTHAGCWHPAATLVQVPIFKVNSMALGISLNSLARRLGRAKSGLSVLAQKGQIPRRGDGSFDPDAVAAALASNLDPARAKVFTRAFTSPQSR